MTPFKILYLLHQLFTCKSKLHVFFEENSILLEKVKVHSSKGA